MNHRSTDPWTPGHLDTSAHQAIPQALVCRRAVAQVAREISLPEFAVLEALTLPWDILVERGCYEPRPNSLEVTPHPRHALSSACVRVPVSERLEAYLFVLVRVPSDSIVCSEPHGDIRSHPSFLAYVQMLREGHEPPYSTLFERKPHGTGHEPLYVTTNRRRCLTAQVVGAPVTGWLNRDCTWTGLPLKLGDVFRSYGRMRDASRAIDAEGELEAPAEPESLAEPLAQAEERGAHHACRERS